MKTFNDLKIGDKIYFVDFNLEEGLASAYAAEVISLKRISEETIKITCRHQTNKIEEYSVYGCLTSSDWMGDTKFFASKDIAISNIKCLVERAKEDLYETHKLLVKVKELK
jgi:hypothetical protein